MSPLMVFGSSYQELHNTILQHLKTGIYTVFCTDILWDRTIYLVTHWWKLLFRNWFVEVSIALVLMTSSFVNSISFQNLIKGFKIEIFLCKELFSKEFKILFRFFIKKLEYNFIFNSIKHFFIIMWLICQHSFIYRWQIALKSLW